MICEVCKQQSVKENQEKLGDGWKIIHGDSRKYLNAMKEESVDAVITDPPYGSGANTAAGRMKSAKSKYVSSNASYQKTLPDIAGDALTPRAWERLMNDCFGSVARVLKMDGMFAVFIDWRQLGALQDIINSNGLQVRGICVWDKRCGRPYRGGFRGQTEYVLWGGKGKVQRHDFYGKGILTHTTKSKGKIHITEKPLALMHDIVQMVRPYGLIVDPFCGSATTGVAAVSAGYAFVGMESVKAYYDIAIVRMQTLKQ